MAKNETLKKAIESIKLSRNILQSDIALAVGVKNTYLSDVINGRVPLSDNLAEKFYEQFQIDKSWLLTGEGEMLKNNSDKNNTTSSEQILTGKLIPLYDADAAAGTEYGMSMEPARKTGLIEIGNVLKDSEQAIKVYGNSMTPNYPAGCVIGTKLHTDSFIEPGRVYIVETRDNRYLKRLYYNDDKTCFHCMSDNQMKYEDGPRQGKLYYQDFEIPFEEVIRLHQVVGVIKRNIL